MCSVVSIVIVVCVYVALATCDFVYGAIIVVNVNGIVCVIAAVV